MKLQFTGTNRRDGSNPKIEIGEEVYEIKDGLVTVPDDIGQRLINGGNFNEVPANGSESVEQPLDDETVLIAKAKSLGIKATRTWGVPKLKAAIAEAEAA